MERRARDLVGKGMSQRALKWHAGVGVRLSSQKSAVLRWLCGAHKAFGASGSIKMISAATGISRPCVGRALRKLEADQLIERVSDDEHEPGEFVAVLEFEADRAGPRVSA